MITCTLKDKKYAVDFISGPSWVSTSVSFSKEKTGTLTAVYGEVG